MKIDRVRIENFRKYQGVHEFNLEKEISIFYGPNGFGKSTFFDALEWCLSGDIKRFPKKTDFSERDIMCFKCDNTSSTCSVEIEFNGHILKRKFNIVSNKISPVTVNIQKPNGGSIRGKAKVDSFLKNEFQNASNQSLMKGLIKQTHILSQDQITDFVSKDNAKERFESLADIMGLKSVLNLTGNIKEVELKILSHKNKLTEELKIIDAKIDQRKSDILIIDERRVKHLAKKLDISGDLDIIHKNISIIREQVLHKNTVVLNQVESAKRVKLMGFENFADCLLQETTINNQISIHLSHEKKAVELQERINKVIHSLREQSSNNVLFKRFESEERKYKKEIFEIIGDADIPDSNTILNELSGIQVKIAKYNMAISYVDEYKSILSEINSIPLKRQSLEKSYNRHQKHDHKLRELLENINKKIEDHAQGPLVKLVSNISDIYKYILGHDNEGVCPVCSTSHGEDLKLKTESSLQKYLNQIEDYKSKSDNLATRKSRLSSKIEIKHSRLEDYKKEIKIIEKKLPRLEKRKQEIEQIENFELELFKENREHLEAYKENLLKNSHYKEQLKEKIQGLSNAQKSLKSLQELTGLVHFQSESESQDRLNRLNKAFKRFSDYTINKKKVISDLKKHLEELKKEILRIPDEFSEKDKLADFSKLIEKKENEKQNIQNELRLISEFSENYSSNLRVSENLKKMVAEKDSLNFMIEQKYNMKLAHVSSFLKSINEKLGATAKDILNQSSSSIQRYFRYLNPLPGVSPIKFEGGKDELKIIVENQYSEHGTNAQYTLSSGQLNVLAISIFLAINESQKVSILDFVAIDDPIQNMDDVNQFSVCDVLGLIEKQLLFSTHDLDFVKLFIKKNEHRKEQIQIFMMDSPSLLSENVKRINF